MNHVIHVPHSMHLTCLDDSKYHQIKSTIQIGKQVAINLLKTLTGWTPKETKAAIEDQDNWRPE